MSGSDPARHFLPMQGARERPPPINDGLALIGACSFKTGADSGLGFEPAVAQAEDVVEAIENHLVMRHHDDGGVLIDGDPAQQIHDDPGAS